MDFYGFAKPGTEFAKPQLQDFAEDQGYDYYAYDMAMEQWQSQFPNLSEFWCSEQTAEKPKELDNSTQSLYDLLAA